MRTTPECGMQTWPRVHPQPARQSTTRRPQVERREPRSCVGRSPVPLAHGRYGESSAWQARPSGLVAPVGLDPSGAARDPRATRRADRGGGQTSWGRYVPASTLAGSRHQHILEQGSRIRSYGAVTGWASLRFRGARYFDGWPPDVPTMLRARSHRHRDSSAATGSSRRVSLANSCAADERELLDGICGHHARTGRCSTRYAVIDGYAEPSRTSRLP